LFLALFFAFAVDIHRRGAEEQIERKYCTIFVPGNDESSRLKIYKLNFMARGSTYWWETRMCLWALPGNDNKKTSLYLRSAFKKMIAFCRSLGLEPELAFRLPVVESGAAHDEKKHWGRMLEEHSFSCLGFVLWFVQSGALSRPMTERPMFIDMLQIVCDLLIGSEKLEFSLVFLEGELRNGRDYGMKYLAGEKVPIEVSSGKVNLC